MIGRRTQDSEYHSSYAFARPSRRAPNRNSDATRDARYIAQKAGTFNFTRTLLDLGTDILWQARDQIKKEHEEVAQKIKRERDDEVDEILASAQVKKVKHGSFEMGEVVDLSD